MNYLNSSNTALEEHRQRSRYTADMKLAFLLAFVGVCYAKTNDAIWMDLFSSNIADAVNSEVNDDENIPQLAGKLGLNTLVALVEKANLTDALSGEGMSMSVNKSKFCAMCTVTRA